MKPEPKSVGFLNSNTTRNVADRHDGEAVSQCSIECAAVKDQGKTGDSRDASGTRMGISRRKALLSGGGMLAAATMLKKFDAVAAEGGGNTKPNLTNAGREIGTTMKDGATVFFKDWDPRTHSPSYSIMDGR